MRSTQERLEFGVLEQLYWFGLTGQNVADGLYRLGVGAF